MTMQTPPNLRQKVLAGYKRHKFLYWAIAGIVAAVIIMVAGRSLFKDKDGYAANIYTELWGIVATVLGFDMLARHREERQLRAQLIREMGGRDYGIGFRAIKELQIHGWLYDGSLRGADLRKAALEGTIEYRAELKKANLQKADLRWSNLRCANLEEAQLQGAQLGDAKLQDATFWYAELEGAQLNMAKLQGANLGGADLFRVNLHEAEVISEQLIHAKRLRFTTMPGGNRYDGRFNLEGDIADALRSGIDTKDLNTMAHFYGVPLEEYHNGQEWARVSLPILQKGDTK